MLYEYGWLGRQVEVTDPVGTVIFAYASSGALSIVTDGNGNSTTYEHKGDMR